MKTFPNIRSFLFLAAGFLSGIGSSSADPYTWTSTATGTLDWTTAGNWSGGNVYVDGAANELIFFADSTTNFSGNRSITTNVPATLSMNTLTLNGKGHSSGAVTYTTTIASSASTWTIGDGSTSIVNLNANFGATAAAGYNTVIAANLTLNQANTLFTGNGTGGFTFSGSIGQASSGYGITKEGTSALTLSGSSLTFTGPLTVNGGSLFLTGNSNLPSGSMTVNTGAILRIGNNTATQIGVAGNYAGNISTGTGGTLQLWSTSAQEYSGVISGSGGIQKAYGGQLTLSGANTYTGKTQFLPQTTAGFTVNVSSFNSVVGGTVSSSLGAPTTVANGTIDLGSGSAQAGVNLTYVSTATGETTDRVINIGFNGNNAHHTITANNASGVLRFTSAFTSNGGTQNCKLILSGTGAGQIDQGLPQLTNSGLDKQGTGTWTLGGSGNFTGPTIITAGTLSLSSATALRFSPFNTASVAGSGTAGLKIATTTLNLGGLTGSNALDSRFTTALGGPSNATAQGGYAGLSALTLTNAANSTSTHSGGIPEGATGMTLTKTGAGTQFLTGTMGYTGATTVNAGVLGSDSTFSGAVTVANGAGLAPGAAAGAFGTFTISNASASALTLNGGNLLMDVSTASNDVIAVTGTTVLNGTQTFLPNPTTGVAAGTYTLMTYGANTGSGSVVFANGTTTLGNATLAVNAGNIQMTVAGGGLDNSVWVGTTATWDSGANWNRNGTPASAFSAGDFVTINDSGSNAATITSAGTVSPASVTVDNTAKAFTISASIGGTGTPLVKLGSNTLTLSGSNSYTGGTFIGGGRVGITSNANLGDAAGGITFNGGELYITNDFSSARPVTLNAVAGNQILFQGNADWTNSGAFTGEGGIIFRQNPNGNTSATLTSMSNDFKGALGIQANNSVMTVKINSLADSPSANGNIVYGAGSASDQVFEWLGTAPSALTLDNRAIEFGGNGNALGRVRNSNTTNAITINTDLVVSGTGTKTLTLESVSGPTNIFDGDIGDGSGTVAVTKIGTGTWVLSGTANTFTGTMTLGAGTLSYASASGANPVTFTATNSFDSNLSYTGSSPLAMTGLVTASALTTGGITIQANGTTPAATINYSNAASLSATSTSTGIRYVTFGGANTGENTFAGAINNNTGAGGNTQVAKTGAGKWVFTGSGNYTGGFFLNQGTVSVASIPNGGVNSPLGANTRINLGRDNNDGILEYTGAGNSSDRDVRIGGPSAASGIGGSAILNNGAGALIFTAPTFNITQTGITFNRTLTLGGSYTGGVNEIQGVIQDNTVSTGLVGVTKTDAGLWKLSGNNTYTGDTTVYGGTLLITGSTSSAGLINVSAGATLGGGGSGGTTALTDDAVLSPGTQDGGDDNLFTLAGLSMSENSILRFEPGTPSNTYYTDPLDFPLTDHVTVTGALLLNGKLLIANRPDASSFNLATAVAGDRWLIMSYLDFLDDQILEIDPASVSPGSGNTYTLNTTSNPGYVYLEVVAVPEAGPAVLFALGAVVLGLLRRRD